MTHLIHPPFEETAVADKFESYPVDIRKKLLALRQLIFETALENDIHHLEETLKWGEPSYLAPKGSTLRINSRAKSPNEYAMFFHCKTKLVDTFKEIYPSEFKYEGNRAIVFSLEDPLPINPLKHCIELSLTYHSVSHLPLLGV